MSTLRDCALLYIEHGLAVVPLVPRSKLPATDNGVRDCSIEPEQIIEWWNADPNYNIGIATGYFSRVVVLDVDGEQGEAMGDTQFFRSANPIY